MATEAIAVPLLSSLESVTSSSNSSSYTTSLNSPREGYGSPSSTSPPGLSSFLEEAATIPQLSAKDSTPINPLISSTVSSAARRRPSNPKYLLQTPVTAHDSTLEIEVPSKEEAGFNTAHFVPQTGDWRVILNVGGRRFETYASTFAKHPTTLLATIFLERNRCMLKPDDRGEYFFDRNGDAFGAILDWYRSGVLDIPPNISRRVLKKELDFFGVPKEAIHSSETPGERFKSLAIAAACNKNQQVLDDLMEHIYSACTKAIEHSCGRAKIDILRNPSYLRTSAGKDIYKAWQWNVNLIDKKLFNFLSDKSHLALFTHMLKRKKFKFELYPISRASFALVIALWDEMET